jgi:hypothetical protein
MVFVPSCIAYANSAEPPSIIIIVRDAPKDLEINIGSIVGYRTDKTFESNYTFYSSELRKVADYTLHISTSGSSFEIKLSTPLKSYNNIFTLDLGSKTLTTGKSLSRSLTLLSIRIGLTLMIEGIVFFIFGFRKKISWIIFLIVNLLTQGTLYVWLNSYSPFNNYIIFSLIFGEILVFIVEIIAFLIIVKEHRRLRTFLYVIVANIFSLIVGGYLITILPI